MKLKLRILFLICIVFCFGALAAQAASGVMGLTITVVYPPASPTNLTVSAVSYSEIDLTWTDNSNNEDGFTIEEAQGTDSLFMPIDSVGANVISYSRKGLLPDTTYFYRVAAFNGTGSSGFTNEASLTTQTLPLGGCSPGATQACTSGANSCGMTNFGTETCGGSYAWGACSASTPPDQACNSVTFPTSTIGSNTIATTTSDTTLIGTSTIRGNVTVEAYIPSGTIVMGNASWDGTIEAPVATTAIVTVPGFNTTVISAIAVGSSESDLTFNNAVKLTFAGQAGVLVGWYDHAGTFAQITDTCDVDSAVTTINGGKIFPRGGSCVIGSDSNGNLVVWTKHFSTFVTYAETVVPAPVNSGGGGGGGGGGGFYVLPPPAPVKANVTVSGSAYPLSTVTVLQDAQVAVQTISGPDGNFTATINNLSGGNYIFSVYAEDDNGNRSSLFTFPVSLAAHATTQISGVFLSPTIALDKQEVKKGDVLSIFGKSAPSAQVTINIHSDQTFFAKITSSKSGAYLYDLDTSQLDMGSHAAIARAATANLISNDSVSRSFIIGDKNVAAQPESTTPLKGDFQNNGHVNLVDFSILAYWYRKPNPPAQYDLNGDGKIDLTDFSIMAYYWTG